MRAHARSRVVLVGWSALTLLSACGDERIAEPTTSPANLRGSLSLGLANGATSDTLSVGETAQLTANLRNNRKRPRPTVWSSSAPNVASVSSSGLVTALSAGATTIKATNQYAADSADIIVRATSVVPASVAIKPDSTADAVGDTVRLTSTVRDSSGAIITGRAVNWSTSDTSIAVVSSAGIVTARKVGLAVVTAACDGVATTAKVFVTAATVATASVTVSPTTANVNTGKTAQLSATALDANGNALSGRTFTWASSNQQVGTVSATGLVTGVAPGTITVTATTDGKSQTAQVTVQAPVTGTEIYPGSDIQAAVNANPAGTTFLLKAGVHRRQKVTPKDGNTFVGEPGTILTGATLVTTFVRESGYWVASNLPVDDAWVVGVCEDAFPVCNRLQELFLDDVPLRRVGSVAEVTSGRWYFDTGARKAYLADDPTSRKVELSITTFAFVGTARNVTVRGLIIEKYANPAQHGAIEGPTSTAWIIRDNEVRLNHGLGIGVGNAMQIINNRVHHQGQMGVGGIGSDVLVENNEIAYNNTAHFSSGWEAGGTKFVKTNRLVVRGNFVHHNRGPGLWTDGDNIVTLYEGNRVEDNAEMGIFHEISYSAIIRNNTVRRNGFQSAGWLYGAGIMVSASSNVEVSGNVVEGNYNAITAVQQPRGSGAYGPYSTENLYVHDNDITPGTGATGLAQDIGDLSYFTSRNNRFDRNTYRLGTSARPFAWMNGFRTDVDWRAYGNDPNGTFAR